MDTLSRCHNCNRVIPNCCPKCPPQPFKCLCGEMVMMTPSDAEIIEEILKEYKRNHS